MKILKLALAALAGAGAGCATAPFAPQIVISALPNCLESNYDAQERLFTIRDLNDIWADPTKNPANQQCLLTVGPSGDVAAASPPTAGRYTVYLSNGGGGGAGGTMQSPIHGVAGGGGGGGGAGAEEVRTTVYLIEGVYKLTIGAGGPGGHVCAPATNSAGGPGWYGSPSNIVNVATGEVVAGVPGADAYARPTVYQHEKLAGTGRPGQGGFGPGQTSGGAGARPESTYAYSEQAQAGASTRKSVQLELGTALASVMINALPPTGAGGASYASTDAKQRGETQNQTDQPPPRGSLDSGGWDEARPDPNYTTRVVVGADTKGLAPEGTGEGGTPGLTGVGRAHPSGGGGGGATNEGDGGSGGGENLRHREQPPVRGSLGSGGGGGQGSRTGCDAGARGGHGYIAVRRS